MMLRLYSYEVDNDQELLACSLCNTISSFFGCFVATQAPPRTLVHEAAGGRTQLAGAVSTLVPLLVVLALGSLFESLPISVLGCITSCAILPLMKQFTQLRWVQQQPPDRLNFAHCILLPYGFPSSARRKLLCFHYIAPFSRCPHSRANIDSFAGQASPLYTCSGRHHTTTRGLYLSPSLTRYSIVHFRYVLIVVFSSLLLWQIFLLNFLVFICLLFMFITTYYEIIIMILITLIVIACRNL